MKKVIKLTESDLMRIVKRVIKEEESLLKGMGLSPFKIGDKYKMDMGDNTSLTFKVTSVNREEMSGTVIAVVGNILPDRGMEKYYRKVKVGDPISFWNININAGYMSFDLQKTFGELDMETEIRDLIKVS